VMEEFFIRVGLPVVCAWSDCGTKGNIKPKFIDETHGGWYKSKLLRTKRKKWFCPEHYEQGRALDNRFFENYKTPDPYPEDQTEAATAELYKLLD
jgi:hypothetical protein